MSVYMVVLLLLLYAELYAESYLLEVMVNVRNESNLGQQSQSFSRRPQICFVLLTDSDVHG